MNSKVYRKLCIELSFPDQGRGIGAPSEPRQLGPRPQHPLQPRDERLHRQQEAGDTGAGPQHGECEALFLILNLRRKRICNSGYF